MKFIHRLAHLLIPRESNNQKAKLLHSSSLTFITLLFILYQLVISFIPRLGARILGYAANISPTEVINLTNQKRAEAGLAPLEENATLSQAAQAKGVDMLNKGYWAHAAPDGTQPWQFFTDFGYKYRYAGENLARDFSNPSSAVEAWMNSASHKENLLSVKYKDIGVAVVEGSLTGVDTTIIVQFFGTKYADTLPVAPLAKAQETKPVTTALPEPTIEPFKPTLVPVPAIETTLTKPAVLVSPFNITRNASLGVAGILLTVLVVDGILVSRRRIARVGGRTFAHIAFLGMIIVIVLLLRAGQIK